jgi:hypothetical protein
MQLVDLDWSVLHQVSSSTIETPLARLRLQLTLAPDSDASSPRSHLVCELSLEELDALISSLSQATEARV